MSTVYSTSIGLRIDQIERLNELDEGQKSQEVRDALDEYWEGEGA